MFSTKNKVGLVLAGLLGLSDVPQFLMPTPDGETGPPYGILVLGSVCGVVTLVAVVIAWTREHRGAVRIAAGARVLSMLSALPAFFVDVDAPIKVLAAVFVVVTIVSLVLMLSPAARPAHVTD
ncbi:hypothetical protein [Aeromicrobium terrae]|jgi:hypothetical protein|uniref:Uncharacterized protein n=1 Tax=Aeromicrobium terrae TaxID=2498846 RepID=A0A5C8NHY2_9ACTN|nr:hypothetical protein [Aeromicrobium terrae]TXL58004.1 hypothetical protein FHP06_11785 [Aeromicrobium terrae]